MSRNLPATAVVVALSLTLVASAEDDVTSLSYISYLERYATVQPATQEDGLEAAINMPLVAGDRIDTAREARVEIRLADGGTLWMDEYSSVSFDAVAYSRDSSSERTVLYLAEGTIMLEIPEHTLTRQPTRIDGASGTVYLNRPGMYRVQTTRDGALRIEVWNGLAEAASSSGGVLVEAESAAEVSAGNVTALEDHLSTGDSFAAWVGQRRQTVAGDSSLHVDMRYSKEAEQLDNYGNWVYLDEYNEWGWQPSVSSTWSPYTAGRWYWTPVGWSWLSYEPWGWLPYHYGRWYFSASVGWCWTAGRCWSPAWVRWCYWPGYVGWSPYGYYRGWYWPRYCDYYGYQPRPEPYPSRRDVVPRTQRQLPPVEQARPVDPSRIALDVNGDVRVGKIDPKAWNVVRVDDFSSPHLSRVVQPGETVFRDHSDASGVVRSAPLITSSPTAEPAHIGVERVFRNMDSRQLPDVTPVMARADTLAPERALQLVAPTTVDSISRRGVTVTTPASPTYRTETLAPGGSPTLSPGGSPTVAGGGSPAPTQRRMTPNIHRSALPSTPSGGISTVTGDGGVRSVAPSQRSGRGPGPVLRGGNLGRESGTAYGTPATRGSVTSPRSGGSTGRTVTGRSPSTGGPVIVPRTAPSRSYRQPSGVSRSSPSVSGSSRSGSPGVRRYTAPSRPSSRSYAPRSSGSSRSAPRSSVSSSRPSSPAPRSSASSGSRSGGSRSSASSSRSSGGSSRSSGGSSRRR